MSRVIVSEIKGFEGTVYIPERFTMPQVNLFSAARRKANQRIAEGRISGDTLKEWDESEIMAAGIFPTLEKMEVINQPERPTVDTFLFTPTDQGQEFMALLIHEFTAVIKGESEVPKG